jgi:hypothetical protein
MTCYEGQKGWEVSQRETIRRERLARIDIGEKRWKDVHGLETAFGSIVGVSIGLLRIDVPRASPLTCNIKPAAEICPWPA